MALALKLDSLILFKLFFKVTSKLLSFILPQLFGASTAPQANRPGVLLAGHEEVCGRWSSPGEVPVGWRWLPSTPKKHKLPEVPWFVTWKSPRNDGLRPLLAPRTHTEAGPGCVCTDPGLMAAIKAIPDTHFISKMLSCETK